MATDSHSLQTVDTPAIPSSVEDPVIPLPPSSNKILVIGGPQVGKKFILQRLLQSPHPLPLLPLSLSTSSTSPSTSLTLPTLLWSIDTRYYTASLHFHLLNDKDIPPFTPSSLASLITSPLLSDIQGVMLVYDAADEGSLQGMKRWGSVLSQVDDEDTVLLMVGVERQPGTASSTLWEQARDWAIDHSIEHIRLRFDDPPPPDIPSQGEEDYEGEEDEEGVRRVRGAFEANHWQHMAMKDRAAAARQRLHHNGDVGDDDVHPLSINARLAQEEEREEAELEAHLQAEAELEARLEEARAQLRQQRELKGETEEEGEAKGDVDEEGNSEDDRRLEDERMENHMASFEAMFERMQGIRQEAVRAHSEVGSQEKGKSPSDEERRKKAEDAAVGARRSTSSSPAVSSDTQPRWKRNLTGLIVSTSRLLPSRSPPTAVRSPLSIVINSDVNTSDVTLDHSDVKEREPSHSPWRHSPDDTSSHLQPQDDSLTSHSFAQHSTQSPRSHSPFRLPDYSDLKVDAVAETVDDGESPTANPAEPIVGDSSESIADRPPSTTAASPPSFSGALAHLQPHWPLDCSALQQAARLRKVVLDSVRPQLDEEPNILSVRLCVKESDPEDCRSPLCLVSVANPRKPLLRHLLNLSLPIVCVRSGDGLEGTPLSPRPRLTAEHYHRLLPAFHSLVRQVLSVRSDISSIMVGFGYNCKGWHSEPSLVVRVSHKGYRPMFEPPLPETHDGFPVFVGEEYCQWAASPPEYLDKMDPIRPGAEIAPENGGTFFGTLGASMGSSEDRHFLTNAHVVYPPCVEHLQATGAVNVLQPSSAAHPTRYRSDELLVGSLVQHVYRNVLYQPLPDSPSAQFGVDAALCKATVASRRWAEDPLIPIPNTTPTVCYTFDPTPIRIAADSELLLGNETLVAKRGAKTGVTYGKIHCISAVVVTGPAGVTAHLLRDTTQKCLCEPTTPVPFLHQYKIDGEPVTRQCVPLFAWSGDSGSMLYLVTPHNTIRPFALLHSITTEYNAYATPIEVVMAALNLDSLVMH